MDLSARSLHPRTDAAEELLTLLADPFAKTLQENTLYSALATSIAFTAIIAILFSALRPYNQVVYAPRLKHADGKHAPPPVGTGYFSWFKPLMSTKEHQLIHYIGMDATLFLRFTRMCRNIFLALTVLYCAILLPFNYVNSTDAEDDTWVDRVTPLKVWSQDTWSLVVIAWAANLTICAILFWNYRKVVGLRRLYFETEDYTKSLHSRTLMISDLPKKHCSDEGLATIIDRVAPNASFARTTIARNVKHLPTLITEYEQAVRNLEKVLSKYLRNPDKLPAARPMCSTPKNDPDFEEAGGAKVDAIEYWNRRVTRLRIQIVESRKLVDRRDAYPYGFASFPDIDEAHAVAHAARRKHPAGSTIKLAPRPTDIIWENMHLNPGGRRIRRLIMTAWIVLLTIFWIGPNAMLAIFLVNLGNLAKVWPAFATELANNPNFWSVFQGVASPAITSGLYLALPVIFRRLQVRAGDQTKTGRERHVMSKLYSFFVFNNLVVFSLFSTIWSFVAAVISDANDGDDVWSSIIEQELGQSLFISLCKISLFWVTWLLQRQLGAAIDLAQLWKLLYSFIIRRVSHPTPREIIELSAPPHFEYAMYYNWFLFYSTVALAFSGLQPLVLPSAALYFSLDVWLKKYLLLYIFVTKTESGGLFWRPLFNRFIFATILSNLVVFLAVWARGDWGSHVQAYAVAPLPLIMVAFKVVCSRLYDDKLYYYSQNLGARRNPQDGMSRNDKLSARFGHPVLYKKLFKPMVHKKAQHKLSEILHSTGDDDNTGYTGYSDSAVKMEHMMASEPGRSDDTGTLRNFELVAETNLDFEHYKMRAEFADEHGSGDIFARPGTPSSMFTSEFGSRPGTPVGGAPAPRSYSPAPGGARSYSPGPGGGRSGHTPYSSALGSQGGGGFVPVPLDRGRTPLYATQNDSQGSLVRNAASIAMPGSRNSSISGGRGGYGPVPQGEEVPEQDPSSYDYYRAPRPRRNP